MNELLKALKHFLTRDLVLVVAGSLPIAGFLYRFERLAAITASLPSLFLLGGVSYLLGYSIQAAFSLLGLTTTAQLRAPGRTIRWLYRRLTREAWTDVPSSVAMAPLGSSLNDREWARIERRVMHKQLCAAAGSSSLVTAALLLWRFAESGASFDLSLTVAAALVGLVLLPVGHVAAAQEAKFWEHFGKSKEVPELPR